ncbi:MAG: DUF3011 domain-containing protein [Proteobacteria bacterium]|nr:DUF3011 domain-containing protein [Pseudomonadota bacterium]
MSFVLAIALASAAVGNPPATVDWRSWFKRHGGDIVACDAKKGERVHCKAAVAGKAVTLLRQRSKTECVRGRDWDVDDSGVWVDHGCRADFKLAAAAVTPPAGEKAAPEAVVAPKPPAVVPARRGVVVCESWQSRWAHCDADVTQTIRLARQRTNDAQCIRSQTWGVDATGIWVSSGCRGEFQVGEVASSGTPVRTIRCESTNGGRDTCAVDTGRGVVLTKQLSNLGCSKGKTWDYDDDGVWVSRGCRGIFTIDVDPATVGQALRCESNHGKENICPLPAGARVRVQEQRSNTPCVEGKNWDVRSDGLHVSHGCRADFHVL